MHDLGLTFLLFLACKSVESEKTDKNIDPDIHYQNGVQFYTEGKFQLAISEFEKVLEIDSSYKDSRLLLEKADSVVRREDSLAHIIYLKDQKEKEILKLQEELQSIKTFNGAEYRGETSSLVIEIALFTVWAKLAKEAKENPNPILSKLGREMESSLKSLQLKEFPKIRADFAKVLKRTLWESDIEVACFGSGNTTLQFTGSVFAANKNKADFQSTLSERLYDFRFKRTNYKWYEYDDEYTYYKVTSESDSYLRLD